MDIVKVQKTRYAVGLWWQVTTSATKTLQEARKLAKKIGTPYSCVVARKGQFGLGKGSKRWHGRPSLATAFAMKGGTHLWICHFTDVNKWWVCAIKDGFIVADGDWLTLRKEDAINHATYLQSMVSLPEPIFCTNTKQVDEVFQERIKGKKLQLLFSSRVQSIVSPLRFIFMLSIAILTLIIAFVWYSAEDSIDNRPLIAMQAARRKSIMDHPELYFPRPWLDASPLAWSNRCMKSMTETPLNEEGWELKEAICDAESFNLAWEFSPLASFLHLPKGATLLTPNSAEKREKFSPLPKGTEQTLLTREKIALTLYESSRLLRLHLNLSWQPKAKKTVREGDLAVPLEAPWHEGTFSITGIPAQLILNKEFFIMLNQMPALVLESLTYSGGTWTLKGKCHGT